jgi:subtilase family serine protease
MSLYQSVGKSLEDVMTPAKPNHNDVPRRSVLIFSTLFSLLLPLCVTAQAAQPDRIVGAIDNSQTVVLKGTVHPKAQRKYDQGPLDPSTKLNSIRIMFTQSKSQQEDLKRFSAEQQDPSSPNYHKWLTPEQYGDRFGLSQHDISKVVKWLRSQGFTVTEIAHGRGWVVFSGTAAQVRSAFHTEVHRYNVDGEMHIANATEPSIPKALAGVTMGIRGLNDFYPRPMGGDAKKAVVPIGQVLLGNPDFTSGGSSYLAPDDIATIYDIAKLYSQGYDGTGQTIAIVGQSDFHNSDLTNFWNFFLLTPPTINKVIDPNTGNPGFTAAEGEADLDLETVSGVARNATIYYVFGFSADDAASYTIDNHTTIPVSVISESFGICEPQAGAAYLTQQEGIAAQGNTEGITWVASSGDTGAAGCEPNGGSSSATTGLAVSEPASLPGVTAVGGTEFSGDVNNQSQYWNTSNTSTGESAKSYIPEMAWNDSPQTGTGPILSPTLAASGGGASIAFTKPSWQVGLGVPAKPNARFVPDVSITASANHDGYIIFCSNAGDGCTAGQPVVFGGTSASAPVFSSILVLLNHYLVKNGIQKAPGLSNVNQTLYQLAQSDTSAVHDIVSGTNIVPCTNPSPNCPTKAPFQFGYSAGAGYDEVTGLGSVDAYNFVTGWVNAAKTLTKTAVTVTPPSVNFGASVSVTLSATVKPTSGNGIPTGNVTFFNGTTQVGQPVTLSGGTASLNYNTNSLAANTYTITATYDGDSTFAPSTSAAATLGVQDFRIAANPTTVPVSAPGQTGTTTLTITPLGAFNQTLSYSCGPLPSEASCAFAAVSATSETLTIATMAPSARLKRVPGGRSNGPFYALLLPGFLGLVFSGNRRRTVRGLRLLSLIAVLALSTLWMPACGGGSSTPSNPGTPTGMSSVTVTATTGGASALTHSVTITLNVQ